jgi:5'-deoxynucleotidase YfbR-like HD superfamily hydrolase
MTWMLTATGKDINLQYLDSFDLTIQDVAFSLANINRFCGHAVRPYSVAEHSLVVVTIMQEHFGVTSPSVLLAGLLHDAHECLTGDLTQPMKQVIGPAWQFEEDRIQRTVLRRFGVWTAFCSAHELIKNADLLALSSEHAQLMNHGDMPWTVTTSHPPLKWLSLAEGAEHTWHEWMQAFVDRFNELTQARAAQALDAHITDAPLVG